MLCLYYAGISFLISPIPNSLESQTALHQQYKQAHFCRSSHKANYDIFRLRQGIVAFPNKWAFGVPNAVLARTVRGVCGQSGMVAEDEKNRMPSPQQGHPTFLKLAINQVTHNSFFGNILERIHLLYPQNGI